MTSYLLLICGHEDHEPTDAEAAQMTADLDGWLATTGGRRLTGGRLVDPERAVTVRVRDGVVTHTDGPFVETKEYVGGFDVVKAQTLEEALEIAATHPVARHGMVEVRELPEGADHLG